MMADDAFKFLVTANSILPWIKQMEDENKRLATDLAKAEEEKKVNVWAIQKLNEDLKDAQNKAEGLTKKLVDIDQNNILYLTKSEEGRKAALRKFKEARKAALTEVEAEEAKMIAFIN